MFVEFCIVAAQLDLLLDFSMLDTLQECHVRSDARHCDQDILKVSRLSCNSRK